MRAHRASAGMRRGGALMALATILLFWLALRLALWQPPFVPASLAISSSVETATETAGVANPVAARQAEAAPPLVPPTYVEAVLPQWEMRPIPIPAERPLSPPTERPMPSVSMASRSFAGAADLVAHAYLLSAAWNAPDGDAERALSGRSARQQGVPSAPAPLYVPQIAEAVRASDSGPRRWAMDAWALWRKGSNSPLVSGRPSYGRSQLGAVARYRLAPSSGHAPEVHLRASAALEGAREREIALGGSARPLPGVPVRLAAEARVSETDRGTEPRAAAYAVSEFPPLNLPGGLTGEAYVQGGYVTGDFATPFVDGQARVSRRLAETDNFLLSAGAGAWGGAQDDAQRLDIGPSAAVTFSVGPTRGRVAAEYRIRVAGEAEPTSGPAITISAGF